MAKRPSVPRREIAVIGAGYVGLPLAAAFANAGKRVVCIDKDPVKIQHLNEGRSYIEDVPSATVEKLVAEGCSPPIWTWPGPARSMRS